MAIRFQLPDGYRLPKWYMGHVQDPVAATLTGKGGERVVPKLMKFMKKPIIKREGRVGERITPVQSPDPTQIGMSGHCPYEKSVQATPVPKQINDGMTNKKMDRPLLINGLQVCSLNSYSLNFQTHHDFGLASGEETQREALEERLSGSWVLEIC